MVGVAAPEAVEAVVKAHKDALAAREVREGSGKATAAALPFAPEDEAVALSIEDAGLLSDSGIAAVDWGLEPTS